MFQPFQRVNLRHPGLELIDVTHISNLGMHFCIIGKESQGNTKLLQVTNQIINENEKEQWAYAATLDYATHQICTDTIV